VGHVARKGDGRGAYRFLVGRPEGERDHLEYLDVNGRIILKLIFKCGMGAWTRVIWLRKETGGGFL